MRPLDQQVILITGATDGLGRAVASALAATGATLLLHGRSEERGERLLRELRAETGNDTLAYYRADFDALSAVRDLAERVSAEHERLDVLLNNAALGIDTSRRVTSDGLEATFQVDYLAPYMLDHLLEDLLVASAPSRIVNVASAGQAPIAFDGVMLERDYDGMQAYCQAKLGVVMLTLDRASELAGTGVAVNALHPALNMPTKIVTHMFTPQSEIADGVRSTMRLVTDPALETVSGRYFDETREARALPQAYDERARARLRALAKELTGVPEPWPYCGRVRLVSWNVAGRVRRQAEQAERVASTAPDLVALQEVTRSTLHAWRAALRACGLEHVLAAVDLSGLPGDRRGLSVLLAARGPLRALDQPVVPWPERVLAAGVADPVALDACVVHSPVSQRPGMVKVHTHEALWSYLNVRPDRPWIVCGDFNTPRREHPDGRVWTFARSSRGVLRPERGERWDAAELALLRGLQPAGFRDAFRTLHGFAEREPTWTWPNGGGYRLDHLMVSATVRVDACGYRHDWREDGLSDHSALVAELEALPG